MTQTKKPIDSLSGRELDAAVAEEVMGWKTHKYGEDCFYGFPPNDLCGDGCKQENHDHIVPHYSSDISAAWSVVNKLKNKPFANQDEFTKGFTVNIIIEYVYSDEWLVHWDGGPAATGKTAPEAIARASLKAVRGEG